MQAKTDAKTAGQSRALWMSTIAFTVCFAVWTIFAIIGIQIKQDLGLNETQFGLLVGTPILTGVTDPHLPRRLDRPIWRPHRLHRGDVGRRLATYFLTWASTYPQFLIAALGRRYRRRIFRGRHRLCFAMVSDREAGHGARHFRRRQCRRRGNKVHRAVCAGRLWLARGCAGVGRRHRDHGGLVLVFHRRRPGAPCAPRAGRKAAQRLARTRTAQERPGLALRALLFLCFRRLRRAVAVAAAISDRRLWRRHQDRRHDRLPPSRSRRAFFAPMAGTCRTGMAHAASCTGPSWSRSCALSSCRIRRPTISCARINGPRHLPSRDGRGAIHGDRVRARLLHGPGQGRSLQAHSGLLPEKCRRRWRARRHDRRAWRLCASDSVRRAQ